MSYSCLYCCVPKCCNSKRSGRGRIKLEGFSFHEFPCNVELRSKWIKSICSEAGENWAPVERDKICSRHFTEDSFKKCTKNKRLKPDAIPTLFYPDRSSANSRRQLAIKLPEKREFPEDSSQDNVIKILKTDIVLTPFTGNNYIPITLTNQKTNVQPENFKSPETINPLETAKRLGAPERNSSEIIAENVKPEVVLTSFQGSLGYLRPINEPAHVPPENEYPAHTTLQIANTTGSAARVPEAHVASIVLNKDNIALNTPGNAKSVPKAASTILNRDNNITLGAPCTTADSFRRTLSQCKADCAMLSSKMKMLNTEMKKNPRLQQIMEGLLKELSTLKSKFVEMQKNELYGNVQTIQKAAEAGRIDAMFLIQQILSFDKISFPWNEKLIQQFASWRAHSPEGYEYPRKCGLIHLPHRTTLLRRQEEDSLNNDGVTRFVSLPVQLVMEQQIKQEVDDFQLD